MEAKLVIVGGKANKRDVLLKLPTVIGRSREADLTVAHPMVSRRHCEVFEVGGLLMLRDLGSLNGTLVGGQRITGEVALRPDDEFSVGPLTFRADYEYAGEIAAAPPTQGVVAETPDFQAIDEGEDGAGAAPDIQSEGPAEADDGLAPAVEAAEYEPDFEAWGEVGAGQEAIETEPALARGEPEVPVPPPTFSVEAPVVFEQAEESAKDQPAEEEWVAEEAEELVEEQPAAGEEESLADELEELAEEEPADEKFAAEELAEEEMIAEELAEELADEGFAAGELPDEEPAELSEAEEPTMFQAAEEGAADAGTSATPAADEEPDVGAWEEMQTQAANDLVAPHSPSPPQEKKRSWWPFGGKKAKDAAAEKVPNGKAPATPGPWASEGEADEEPQPAASLPEEKEEPEEPAAQEEAQPLPDFLAAIEASSSDDQPPEQEPEEEPDIDDEAFKDFLKGLQ
jgi:hypothetical protein